MRRIVFPRARGRDAAAYRQPDDVVQDNALSRRSPTREGVSDRRGEDGGQVRSFSPTCPRLTTDWEGLYVGCGFLEGGVRRWVSLGGEGRYGVLVYGKIGCLGKEGAVGGYGVGKAYWWLR